MKQVLPEFYDACDRFLEYVDLDSEAYAKIVTANRLPESTEEEIESKQSFYRYSILNAINVPRKLMSEALDLMNGLQKLCPVINMNAVSDLQVAIVCFKTAIYGAYFNVMINLENVSWDLQLRRMVGMRNVHLIIIK